MFEGLLTVQRKLCGLSKNAGPILVTSELERTRLLKDWHEFGQKISAVVLDKEFRMK